MSQPFARHPAGRPRWCTAVVILCASAWGGGCEAKEQGRRGEQPAAQAQSPTPSPPSGSEPRAQRPVADEAPPGAGARPRARGRSAERRPVLEDVAVYGAREGAPERGAVRVVLRFDRVAVFSRGEVAAGRDAPQRMFLDFEGAAAAAAPGWTRDVGEAGLARVEARPAASALRVAFELEAEAEPRLFVLSDPYRVVVDVGAAPRAAFDATTRSRRRRTVLLDPGHGGDDLGARYEDLVESRLALDITRRASRLLASRRPDVRVLMTRHGDDFVSLEQRTAMANAADADVFVSVHLNAAEGPVRRGGVATFVLDASNDEQALRFAARENGTTTEEVTQLQHVLAGLHRQGQVEASRHLAGKVHDALLGRARQVLPELPSRGVRDAMFYVLVGARMPAVLVEASFMTHPAEAEMLRTERYRQALADGIAEGVLRYLGDR